MGEGILYGRSIEVRVGKTFSESFLVDNERHKEAL